ncbi:MAG: hypothetical protein JST30_05370 [Armatimonadetes bacterium]|nr:hypothetical protein [Armatimonadota bacterium]
MRSLFVFSGAVVLASAASAQYVGPSPYLSSADSPFAGAVIEDFEDGSLSSWATASGGVALGPGAQTDSVDGDDGNLDGFGNAGHSWYLNVPSVTFKFDAGRLGGLPTKAGLVWTDVGAVSSGDFGFADVTFEAFDQNGASLGVTGPFLLGDGQISGGAAEDRFFGIVNAGGVSAITVSVASSSDWEVDHVQYSDVVPEPALMGALALGSALLKGRRKAGKR